MKCMSQYLRIVSLKMRWPLIWATFGIQTTLVMDNIPIKMRCNGLVHHYSSGETNVSASIEHSIHEAVVYAFKTSSKVKPCRAEPLIFGKLF